MENEKSEEMNRPVTGWDKIHALAMCVLAVVGIVIFVGPYIQRLIPQSEVPPAPQKVVQPQMISTYGLPPLQMVDGKPVACAAPPTYEDLAHAFVCVCDGPKRPPIGSGVFVGVKESKGLRVYLMTACHVAGACIAAQGEEAVSFIVHCPNGTNDVRKTYLGNGISWRFPRTGSDLAVFDVTQTFNTLRKEGVDVRYVFFQYVPLQNDDPAAVQGSVVIRRGDFDKYKLGIGTEVGILGLASEIWDSMIIKGRQPLGFRTGRVAVRNDSLPRSPTGAAPIYIIESDIHPGYSGGPVFARYTINGLDYFSLIGVVKGCIGKITDQGKITTVSQFNKAFVPSGFATVVPIDDLVDRPTWETAP